MSQVKTSSETDSAWTPDSGSGLLEPIDQEDIGEELEPSEEGSQEKVLIASDSFSDSTYSHVKSRLKNDGVEVEDLETDNIEVEEGEVRVNGEKASELDAKVYLRPKRWTDLDESPEDLLDLIMLQREGVEFYGDPQTALLAEDKKATKNVFRSSGIGTVEDFTYEEAVEEVEDGEEIVVKPRFNSSNGDGIETVSSTSELEEYEKAISSGEYLAEEMIEHGEGSTNSDMRMIVTGEDVIRKQRVDGDGIANNLSNGGSYAEADPMSYQELQLSAKASEIMGNGFYSIDYIREDDGSVNVMEINSTSGTKIDRTLEKDLYGSIAEGIQN